MIESMKEKTRRLERIIKGKNAGKTDTFIFSEVRKMIELALAEEREANKPELYVHIKSGVIYEFIAAAHCEESLKHLAVYRNEATKLMWVRPMQEFNEKFRRIPAAPKDEASR